MSPTTHSDGPDGPRLIDELIPGVAAMVDDVVVGVKDAVREPVIAHELPDVFDRVQFGRAGRQQDNGDVVRDGELGGGVPSGLIHEQDGVGIGRDGAGYFREVQVHCRRVAPRQNQAGPFPLLGTNGAEEIGRSCALVTWGRWPGSAFCPAPRDLVLLADAGLILEPDFYGLAPCFLRGNLLQLGGKFFLKAVMVSASWA